MEPTAKLHKHARRIALEIARGKTPRRSREEDDLLTRYPELVFESLEGLAHQLALGSPESESLASAYQLLLVSQLQDIGLAAESGAESARDLVEEIDGFAAELMRSGVLDGEAGMVLASIFHDARFPVGKAMRAAFEEGLDAAAPSAAGPGEIDSLLGALVAEIGDNPFALAHSLAETTHAAPTELRSMMAKLLAAGKEPAMREAAALMVLDEAAEVRRRAAEALRRHAATLSTVALRRLTVMRKWLPEDERRPLDEAVRTARSAMVAIAAAPAPPPRSEILASSIDGADAQSFFVVLPSGTKRLLASILLKGGVGVSDAWVTPPSSQREIAGILADARASIPLRTVDGSYLDRCVGHALAVGLEAGSVPPPLGLLQAAEAIGGEAWAPATLDWAAELDRLCRDAPPSFLGPAPLQRIIETSADWGAAEGLAESWFEDGPEVGALVRRGRKALDRVLKQVFEPRKPRWAERFLRVALWLEAGADIEGATRFALLAREVASGRPIDSVPLMRQLAMTTIAAARA